MKAIIQEDENSLGRFHHSPTARVGIFILLNNSHCTQVEHYFLHDYTKKKQSLKIAFDLIFNI
jgi:hypothetical protein